MPKLIKGENLNISQIRQVKAAFVYRLTTENGYPRRNPCGATVPAITDQEWIKQHAFYIKRDGSLAAKPANCEPVYMAE